MPAATSIVGEPESSGPAICRVRSACNEPVGLESADHARKALPADLEVSRQIGALIQPKEQQVCQLVTCVVTACWLVDYSYLRIIVGIRHSDSHGSEWFGLKKCDRIVLHLTVKSEGALRGKIRR